MRRSRPQSIVYVVDRYPELSQTFVHDEIIELRRQGHRVTIVALRHGDGDGEPADYVATQPSAMGVIAALASIIARRPRSVLQVCRLLRQMKFAYSRVAVAALPVLARQVQGARPERVHAHFAWGASSVAAYLAAYLDVPMSVTVHARDLYVDPHALPAKFRAADLVVTVCEFNRRWLTDHGCPPAKISVVPCGVALPEKTTTRQTGLILGVGRLVPKKGFDVLLTAAALARARAPHLRIAIVGDGPERGRLEALVDEHDLAEVVTFHGALQHDQTLETLNTASVFALPCRVDDDGDSDALPVVIREAMARAVPVVTTFVAGIPETVTTEVGWLVPSNDSEALSNALVEALSKPEMAQLRGERGRERISEQFTIRDCVSTLSDAFADASVDLSSRPERRL